MALSFEVVKEFIEKSKRLEEEAKKNGREYFQTLLENLFEQNPSIQNLMWTQGTPAFNDGEPCTFHTHEINFTFTPDYLGSARSLLLAEPGFEENIRNLCSPHSNSDDSKFQSFENIMWFNKNSILEFINGNFENAVLNDLEDYDGEDAYNYLSDLNYLRENFENFEKRIQELLKGKKFWVYSSGKPGIERSLTTEESENLIEQFEKYKLVCAVLEKNNHIFSPEESVNYFVAAVSQNSFQEILDSLYGNAKILVSRTENGIKIEHDDYDMY